MDPRMVTGLAEIKYDQVVIIYGGGSDVSKLFNF
jgi:hypothetical protein